MAGMPTYSRAFASDPKGFPMRAWIAGLAAAAALLAGPVGAAEPMPQGVLQLSTAASVELPNDLLRLVFSTTREGADAVAVQAALKEALDAALAEARGAAQPGRLDVQTGAFALQPRHAPKGGGIAGWQGSAELIVEGRDIDAIAKLPGRIRTMTIARVGRSLSREARQSAEAEAASQAIAGYRAKAERYAKQFGYASATLLDVHVSSADAPGPVPMMAERAMSMSAAADAPLPVEPGKATVTVHVSGRVQMLK